MKKTKLHKKLIKLQVKAENCETHEKAIKILTKADQTSFLPH